METQEDPGRETVDWAGCGEYLFSPAIAAVGAFIGTWWTVRGWDDCPLGNNVSNDIGLQYMTMPAVWLSMTVVLVLVHAGLRRRPRSGGFADRRLALILLAVALTVLYRVGMGLPHVSPDDGCYEGYPLFPFIG
ncbi:hypothetical protein [Streptomyces sp. NPDC026673]|uniref:hypothetical protein n=1 Tax=Streptomyces sp. NPDC026673 TaxID=3155724 RepID=UPI003411253E